MYSVKKRYYYPPLYVDVEDSVERVHQHRIFYEILDIKVLKDSTRHRVSNLLTDYLNTKWNL